MTGDIHQPLHSVSLFNETFKSGDRGGNSLTIYLQDGSKTNLHSFWDAGGMRVQNNSWQMVRPLNSQNQSVLSSRALSFMSQYGD